MLLKIFLKLWVSPELPASISADILQNGRQWPAALSDHLTGWRGMQTKLSTFYANGARRYNKFLKDSNNIWNTKHFFQIPKTSITIRCYKIIKNSWYVLLTPVVQLSLHSGSWALYCIRKTRGQNLPTTIKPNYLTLQLNTLCCDGKIKAVLLVFFKEMNFILHFSFSLNILCLNKSYKLSIEYLWYSSKTNTVDQGAF